jgi:hypothetical protein
VPVGSSEQSNVEYSFQLRELLGDIHSLFLFWVCVRVWFCFFSAVSLGAGNIFVVGYTDGPLGVPGSAFVASNLVCEGKGEEETDEYIGCIGSQIVFDL